MQEIAESGKLVIAVTHSQEVAKFGTRTIHISDGKIDNDTIQKKVTLFLKKHHNWFLNLYQDFQVIKLHISI